MSTLKKEDLSIKEENKENFKETVIERSNLTNQFTIADIEKHLAHLKKIKTEADATASVAQATVDNIERNHKEFLDTLTDEQKHTVHMWQEHQAQVKELEPQQAEIDEEVAKHEEYLDVIYNTFGFVKSEVSHPSKVKHAKKTN